MSELTIQEGIQTIIQGIEAFSDADVVINDWSIFDLSVANAPYVLISTSDDFRVDLIGNEIIVWDVGITLIENFTYWDATLNNILTRRQALIDEVIGGNWSGLEGLYTVQVQELRAASPILPHYLSYVEPEDRENETPIFLYQDLVLMVEEFGDAG